MNTSLQELPLHGADLISELRAHAEAFEASEQWVEAADCIEWLIYLEGSDREAEIPGLEPQWERLAHIRIKQRHFDKAEMAAARALRINTNVIASHASRGSVAFRHFEETCQRNEERYRDLLTVALYKQGKFDLARQSALLNRQLKAQLHGAVSRQVADAMMAQARAEMGLGNLSGARLNVRHAQDIYEGALGRIHVEPWMADVEMGTIAMLMNRLDEAETLLFNARTGLEERLGSNHEMTAVCLDRCAQLLRRLGRREEAEEIEAHLSSLPHIL